MSTSSGRHKFYEQARFLSARSKSTTDQLSIEVRFDGPKSHVSARVKPKRAEIHAAVDDNHNGIRQDQVVSEKQLIKNIVILGISSVFVFSSFFALQNIQSSIFQQTGLGLKAFCCVYGLMILSSVYGPMFVQKLTPNWTIALSFVMISLLISTFFYPRLYTLIPSAVPLGLSLGPMFSAYTSILMQLVSKMTCLTDVPQERVQQRFLRMFYLFLNISRISGNLLTALLLRYGGDVYVYPTQQQLDSQPEVRYDPDSEKHDPSLTVTLSREVASRSLCATNECQDFGILRDVPKFIFLLPSNVSLMLVSVYLGLALTGVAIVTTLLDKFDLYVYQDPLERSLCFRTLKNLGLTFVDPQQRLLLPFVLFIGMEQGFMSTTFTQAYVSCALGLEAVGYTMMCMGAMNTVGALAVHQFAKHFKRPLIMAAGFVFHAGLLMVLWLWRPVKDDVAVFYVIAAAWGLCNAVWETLTLTFVVTTYTDEWYGPFAAYSLVQALGLTLAFSGSLYLCPTMQIYILAGVFTLVAIPYTCLEVRVHQQRKNQEQSATL
ncbi:protein unc-93 homolog A-like [Limulus polyphemus]|uniref:Protein unc-93 homolog A-like n=1 Tax=Limulus polyphemus TaxID=6850 RepID=A0ABM1S9A7_LIMPO|nr:protein unc-93 homolog A-like [Limulus polyphemus]XP_022240211.1 protein unc-93 homolog A-like [Limulus polyphemus]XP_022240212.1 protein unc-93 homolog A-like [Limulus polyphemus]